MSTSKFIWTDEKIEYLKNNWGKESIHSMKKNFGCTWYYVAKKAQELGLELPQNNDWTDEQKAQLKELAEIYHYEDIAVIMNRTPLAIYIKARRLGIVLIQDRRIWTTEEEDFLKENWGNHTIEYIAKTLKRTVFSLKVKAVRMGLGPMIANNLEDITLTDVSDILKVGLDKVYKTWIKRGLKVKKIRVSKKKVYMAVSLENLLSFLENNQDEWDSRNLEPNILGIEPQWLKEKRIRDFKKNPKEYRRWLTAELNKMKDLLRIGKDPEEIAELLNRTEGAVKDRLRSEGFSYKMGRNWRGKEFLFLKENYPHMTQQEIADAFGRTRKAIDAKVGELGIQKRKKKNLTNI